MAGPGPIPPSLGSASSSLGADKTNSSPVPTRITPDEPSKTQKFLATIGIGRNQYLKAQKEYDQAIADHAIIVFINSGKSFSVDTTVNKIYNDNDQNTFLKELTFGPTKEKYVLKPGEKLVKVTFGNNQIFLPVNFLDKSEIYIGEVRINPKEGDKENIKKFIDESDPQQNKNKSYITAIGNNHHKIEVIKPQAFEKLDDLKNSLKNYQGDVVKIDPKKTTNTSMELDIRVGSEPTVYQLYDKQNKTLVIYATVTNPSENNLVRSKVLIIDNYNPQTNEVTTTINQKNGTLEIEIKPKEVQKQVAI